MAYRIRAVNDIPIRTGGHHVLYWMTAFRRAKWNHSLDRAVALAQEHEKPLLVLEALRTGYPWASDRLHRFIIDGMHDNAQAFRGTAATYYPYLEEEEGAGSGLLEELAKDAVAVVTDDFPCFFLPRMVAAAGRKLAKLHCRLEAIDGNGLYPMRDTDRVFTRAMDFRRHLQKRLPEFFDDKPSASPLAGVTLPTFDMPKKVLEKWPRARDSLLDGSEGMECFPIDHSVAVAPDRGGSVAADARMEEFFSKRLAKYSDRNQPDADAASGLSPYLHFGHISVHQIFWKLAEVEQWTPKKVARSVANGKREGYWKMSSNAEDFLEEILTWREIGYNMCALTDEKHYTSIDSLANWTQISMEEHKSDPRPVTYTLEELEGAKTGDEIWNAAQRQLVAEGRIHNYLRMLWGKKVLQWSKTYQEALDTLIHLNNKYALDGRNPNSYSGIFWVFGRYDRAWGPVRPIFGKIRYMTSDSTRRKLKLDKYLAKYGDKAAAAAATTGKRKADNPFTLAKRKKKSD